MGMFDNLLNNFAQRIASYIQDSREMSYKILGDYTSGDHRKQLKTRPGQQDDNIIQNFVGLAVDRSVSRLFRGGVDFVLPENNTKQQEYIDLVWDLNKKGILLYQLGLHGAVYGDGYIKIIVDALNNPIDNSEDVYPRLQALYPRIVRMRTNPQDMDEVIEYIIEYAVDVAGKETAYRENTIQQQDGTWVIENWVKEGSAQWVLVSSVAWGYDFPPIIHWKNLPSLNSIYGDSDIDDVINIQDKSNFTVSNTGKIIKYHASPTTILTGVNASEVKPVDNSPDKLYAIPNENAKVQNLELESDLQSSRLFALDLRQSIFDVAREVDLQSMKDKVGDITNFGLRVMYTDATDKNDTKRQLYGEAFKEVNRRLLVLSGYNGEQSDPGSIQWGDPLPVNISEEMNADKIALDMHIVTEDILAQKYADRWGMDWEDLEPLLEAENEERQRRQEELFGQQTQPGGSDREGVQPPEPGRNNGQAAQRL